MIKKLFSLLTALLFVGTMWGAIADGTYVLVTSTSDLEAGAHYIIASGDDGDVYCISNVSNNNNRKTVAAEVSSEEITVGSSSSVMTFTLGGTTGAWTFATDNYAGTAGYLTAGNTSNKNYLTISTGGSDNKQKWAIEFSSNEASMVATAGVSPYLRYNPNNGSPIFSGYRSTNYTDQNPVYLYKLAPSDPSSVADPTFTPTVGSFQDPITVTLGCTTEGAAIYYTTDATKKDAPSTTDWTLYNVESKPSFNTTTTIYAAATKDAEWSNVATKTYTLYPTEMTCVDARTAALSVSANNVAYADGLSFTVTGFVTNTPSYDSNNNYVTFYMADATDGGEVLQAYHAACAQESDAPSKGEKVEVTGQLTKYGSTAEFAAGATFTIIHEPYVSATPTTIDFGTVEQNEVVAAKTVAVSYGYLTGSVTYSGLTTPFTAEGTIAASGDEITITPSTATIGEYSQTLTIQSAADSKSVSVTVKMNVVAPFSGKKLTFDLSSNPKEGDDAWPTSNSTTTTNYVYTLGTGDDAVDYTFALNNVKCNSGYLMLTSTAILGLPAVVGHKLVKVVAANSGGCSQSTQVAITSDENGANVVTGGTVQTWSTQGSTYTYTLSGTTPNTMYYLYVTNKNCQIVSLDLYYEFTGWPDALDNTEVADKAVKTIVNGQLFIEKYGRIYNAQGQLVK